MMIMDTTMLSIFAKRNKNFKAAKVLEEKIERIEKFDRVLIIPLIFDK